MTPEHLSEFSEAVAEALQGSCLETVEGAMAGVVEFNPRFTDCAHLEEDDLDHDMFSNTVFSCGCCGWWCEAGERNESNVGNGDVCSDCLSEEVEDCPNCLSATPLEELSDNGGQCESCCTEEENECEDCCCPMDDCECTWCNSCGVLCTRSEERRVGTAGRARWMLFCSTKYITKSILYIYDHTEATVA